jgi:hypothetical protein
MEINMNIPTMFCDNCNRDLVITDADESSCVVRPCICVSNGERDREVLCGKAALKALKLTSEHNNAPIDVTNAIKALQERDKMLTEERKEKYGLTPTPVTSEADLKKMAAEMPYI